MSLHEIPENACISCPGVFVIIFMNLFSAPDGLGTGFAMNL